MSVPGSLRFEDVTVGDELPPLDIPLTRTVIVAKVQLRQPRVGPDAQGTHPALLVLPDRGVEARVGPPQRVVVAEGEKGLDAQLAGPGAMVLNHRALLAVDEEELLLQPRAADVVGPDRERIEAELDQLAEALRL